MNVSPRVSHNKPWLKIWVGLNQFNIRNGATPSNDRINCNVAYHLFNKVHVQIVQSLRFIRQIVRINSAPVSCRQFLQPRFNECGGITTTCYFLPYWKGRNGATWCCTWKTADARYVITKSRLEGSDLCPGRPNVWNVGPGHHLRWLLLRRAGSWTLFQRSSGHKQSEMSRDFKSKPERSHLKSVHSQIWDLNFNSSWIRAMEMTGLWGVSFSTSTTSSTSRSCNRAIESAQNAEARLQLGRDRHTQWLYQWLNCCVTSGVLASSLRSNWFCWIFLAETLQMP